MNSKTHLEYALFQLTPTRTRCDLVVFSGGHKEKLASGLVEPFISHLKYAKEQLPKGGYSISLRPPSSDSSWFTKGTLERFVRFVSTPEVLERFVTLEKEITQIESSVQSNEREITQIESSVHSNDSSKNESPEPTEYGFHDLSDADNNGNKSLVVFKPKDEGKRVDGAVQEENSKIHLQRVLETRKAVLRREQAMAYFRAFVAGYEMDCIDDLIDFADTFGASRLRDACISFKELCYKKHNDGLWMNELAAMQPYAQPELPYLGTSGIILTTENNYPSQSIMQNIQNGGLPSGEAEPNGSGDVSESAASHASSEVNQGQMPPTNLQPQYPMSWPNQFPQFMYNFPNQQVPPYQGYPFPGMHPSHYQGNMQWPPNREAYGDGHREPSKRRTQNSSSRKKEKSHTEKISQTSEEDENTEPSDSASEDELDAFMQNDQKNSSRDQPHKKRNGKKSSRMVVIRNINYITSKRKDGERSNESDESSLNEDEFIDGDALKQRVEDAVGSLDKHKSTPRHHKKRGGNKTLSTANKPNDSSENMSEGAETNENWGAFQNLLLRADESIPNEVETQHSLDVRDEYFAIQSSESGPAFASSNAVVFESERGTKQRVAATDSFIVTERDNGNEFHTQSGNFEGEGFSSSMKKRDYTDEELLFSQRNNDQGGNFQDTFPDSSTESSLAKIQRGEDWFIIGQSEKLGSANATRDSSIFDTDNALALGGNNIQTDKSNRNVLVDDSFMIQDRALVDDHSDSQWRTDISMVSGYTVEQQHESEIPDPSVDKSGRSALYEPEDLYMMVDRSSGIEPTAAWTAEVDYGMDISLAESRKQQTVVAVDDCVADEHPNGTGTDAKNNKDSEKKQSGKDARSKPLRGSLAKSKTEIISRSRKPSTISRVTMQKTKFETEEETRKRMEELVIERQKRIAERSAARGISSVTSKKGQLESKKTAISVKDDKRTPKSVAPDTKKLSSQKSGLTNSSTKRLTSSTEPLKPTQSKKTSAKVNAEMGASLSPKIARDENKKSKLESAKSSKQSNRSPTPLTDFKDKEQASPSENKPEVHASVTQEVHLSVNRGTPEDKLLNGQPSMSMKQEILADVDTQVDKNCDDDQIGTRKSPLPVNQQSTKLDYSSLENGTPGLVSSILHNENKTTHSLKANGVPTESAVYESNKVLDSTAVNLGDTDERIPASDEILEEEITSDWVEHTPPSTIDHNLDQSHSRKKWTSEESTSAAKGLKKLLMFGRKKQVVV